MPRKLAILAARAMPTQDPAPRHRPLRDNCDRPGGLLARRAEAEPRRTRDAVRRLR